MDTSASKAANALQDGDTFDAIVVGAGFAGLYQLLQLRDNLGLSVAVLEAGDGVGGTWYWNRYPGARCDNDSYTYCYTFDEGLYQDWSWTERNAGHAEIRRYLDHVADRFGLRRNITFGTRVIQARYDEAKNTWSVKTEAGDTYYARFLITAVGCLSATNIPAIDGLEDFEGDWYHSGLWPHEDVDFTGKRVGQIGTGSTGIQLAPEIAQRADHLTVFQRTANYSIPARNAPVSREAQADVKANYSALRDKMRSTSDGFPFDVDQTSALDVSEAERTRRYEQAWEEGGRAIRGTFNDIVRNKEANDTISNFIRAKIQSIVNDPKTARILTPMDHPFASKRPPLDTNYFETFNRDNVSIVDLRATPIDRITPKGILTGDDEHALDVIVFATGFDAFTGPLLALDIIGTGGRSMKKEWAEGPATYLGLQVPGYPNLFTITGPGSPSVLANVPVAIEQHVDWITACIKHMMENDLCRVEAQQNSAVKWMEHVNEAAQQTLLPSAKHSWYLGANVPGKPQVFLPYVGGMARYADHCAEVANDGYRGFDFG